MSDEIDSLLGEQIRYYEERAREYEDLYHRRGRYDRGEAFNAHWREETSRLEAAVETFAAAGGSFLELACGSGLWTRLLVGPIRRLVALDASPTMLALNRARYGAEHVEYIQADLWSWEPPAGERFDAVVMGFFVSHIPPERFVEFWDRLRGWLAPTGRVFLCDDLAGPDRPRSGDTVVDGPAFSSWRKLDDGRRFRIVKIFYSPESLAAELARAGWDAELTTTGTEFVFGTATPRA
jgi:demethylmenaquinone methyltransferase/2-methoxy-6-polyprenyl-1,4-benzoquinol methylase